MAYTNLESCCFQQLKVEILGVLSTNVDNIKCGDINNNITLGINALCSNLCSNAVCNVAIGINALCSYVSGSCNILVPGDSFNTVVGAEGFSSLVCGGYNTSFGAGNAPDITCGDYNTVVGSTNLFFSSESFAQVAVGSQVLQNWCGVGGTGRNIGIGFSALKGELIACGGMTGERNIGIGLNAGLRLRGANTNILLGNNSGYVSDVDGCYLKNGCWNVIVGNHSGRGLVDGNYNTIIGSCIGKVVPLGDISNSVIVGDGCGCIKFEANNLNQVKIGNNSGVGALCSCSSNFIGENAGYNACLSSHSNFIGTCAGYCTCGSSYSNFIGFSAGGCFFSGFNAYSFEICHSNFIGTCAGAGSCCVSNSNFIGFNAGRRATKSSDSTFIGTYNGNAASFSCNSIFIGTNAGGAADNSSNSIFIGTCAGSFAHCSSNSAFIGSYMGCGQHICNTMIIGPNAYYDGSVFSCLGDTTVQFTRGLCISIDSGGCVYSCLRTSSARAMKKDICQFGEQAISILNDVDVVSYRYKTQPDNDPDYHIGFIADDTCEVLSGFDHGQMKQGSVLGVLIKAVQELSEEIVCLKAQINK